MRTWPSASGSGAIGAPASRPGPGSIVVVGSLNADLVVTTERHPRPGETVMGGDLTVIPGGKSANQAVAAARLGGRVRLIGSVGDDANGELLRRSVADAGVDVAGVRIRPGSPTGTAVVTVDAAGENTIVVSPGANALIEAGQVDGPALDGAALMVLCLEIPIEVVLATARAAGAAGVPVVTNLSPSRPVPPELLARTDVLLLNDHEARDLIGAAGTVSGRDLQAGLAARGIRRAIVTGGARGCHVFDGGPDGVHVPTVAVEAVDTTGCGDAFTGGLALRLAAGDGLVDAARFATQVGAFAATRPGAQSSYPSVVELDRFLARAGQPPGDPGPDADPGRSPIPADPGH